MATNVWEKFQKLIAGPAMEVATITTVNSNGTSRATTANGGQVQLIGTNVAAGKKAFIQDGRVISEAPNLTYYELEV